MKPLVDLVLFVFDGSAACAAAVRNLERTLARFNRDQVAVTIRNLTSHPLVAGEMHIIVVPTLVMRSPRRELIAGDLADDELDDLLVSVGVERTS